LMLGLITSTQPTKFMHSFSCVTPVTQKLLDVGSHNFDPTYKIYALF
jgi:hypothetical protein